MSQRSELKNKGAKPEKKQSKEVTKEQLETLADIVAQRIVELIKAGSV